MSPLDYSLDLPYQLFRKSHLGLPNVWFGSFRSLESLSNYTFDIGMPADAVVVTSPQTLPTMSEIDHLNQLNLIERELRNTRKKLLLDQTLESKLQILASVKALEKKRMQWKLHYFSLVAD